MKEQNNDAVRKCARPMELVHEPVAKRAVVCLHGYTGYPGELALPAKRLFAADFDVFVPRYPGHGTNGADFMQTRRDDWVGEAERVYQHVSARYEQVSLVGHSMGGVIAVILAHRHEVSRAVLYAPALSIPSLSLPLITALGIFVKKRPKQWEADPRFTFHDDRDPDDDAFFGAEYWGWHYPRQIRQLALLQREAVSLLDETSTDFLVITGGLDTTVSDDSGRMVEAVDPKRNRWVHLEQATHMIPYDIDDASRDRAMDETVAWLDV